MFNLVRRPPFARRARSPRPAVPPSSPPLLLSVALGATLVLGGWLATRVVQVVRFDNGYSLESRERLATRARPAWDELARQYGRQNPPGRTEPGQAPPTIDAMLARPAVRAAFRIAPDLTMTLRLRGGAVQTVDLTRWRPTTLGLRPLVAPVVSPRHDAEGLIQALVHEGALKTVLQHEFTHVGTGADGHRLHVRGSRQLGWIGYDTAVVDPDTAQDLLDRHGLAGLVAWSFGVRTQRDAVLGLILRDAALPAPGGMPLALGDLTLLPDRRGFFDYHLDVFLGGLRDVVLLLLATGAALLVSLRQLRHLMRHQAIAAARGRFVSGMSHEMRTPLTTIKLYAEMLQHGVVREEDTRAAYLATIGRECDRLGRLVDNVLAYAALESKARPLILMPVDAKEALEEAIAAARGPLEQAGLAVTLHAPVPLTLAADRDALVLAVANLLTNAAKYAAAGREVIVSALPDGPDGCVISVRDFGPGVPAAERHKVFEPFYRRVGGGLPNQAPGTGLGLALVQETVRGHGGQIAIEGQPGEGAEFRLRLPLAPAEDAA